MRLFGFIDSATGRFKRTANPARLTQEVASGTVNGTNDTFTIANAPSTAASVVVFVDGMYTNPTKYALSGGNQTITFIAGAIPQLGQDVSVLYTY